MRACFIASLILVLAACAPSAPMTVERPVPMIAIAPATPAPPMPTFVAPRSACALWWVAALYSGWSTCVQGRVFSTSQSDNAFFINFDNTRTSFYGISLKYHWYNLKGTCVILEGLIQTYQGRPVTIIRNPGQLRGC